MRGETCQRRFTGSQTLVTCSNRAQQWAGALICVTAARAPLLAHFGKCCQIYNLSGKETFEPPTLLMPKCWDTLVSTGRRLDSLRNYDCSPSLWLWNLCFTTVQHIAVFIKAKSKHHHSLQRYLETANRGDICQGASSFHCMDRCFASLRAAKRVINDRHYI